jgi:hypothetical protein
MGPCLLAKTWPDYADLLGIAGFLAAVVLLPIAGYWLTILDIRAYLRALRGALVRITSPSYSTPSWLDKETPPCLRALGLEWPCSEEDVKIAYHRMARELHPDHGGDIRRFLLLQQQLEQANHYVRQRRARS